MTTAVATWPTSAELDEIAGLFRDAFSELYELEGRLKGLDERLDRPHGEPIPTLVELGALSRFIAEIEHDLENSGAELASIRKVRDFAAVCIPSEAGDAS